MTLIKRKKQTLNQDVAIQSIQKQMMKHLNANEDTAAGIAEAGLVVPGSVEGLVSHFEQQPLCVQHVKNSFCTFDVFSVYIPLFCLLISTYFPSTYNLFVLLLRTHVIDHVLSSHVFGLFYRCF